MKTVRLFDKTASLGAIIATMGCAMCFPYLASIGAFVMVLSLIVKQQQHTKRRLSLFTLPVAMVFSASIYFIIS